MNIPTKGRTSKKSGSPGVAIVQYSLEGYQIASFKNISEATKITGINNRLISKCALRKAMTAGGYVWARENEEPIFNNRLSKGQKKYGLTYEEIIEQLGISKEEVKAALSRFSSLIKKSKIIKKFANEYGITVGI